MLLTIPDVGGAQMMEQVQMISHGANSDHSVMQVDGMMVNAELGDGRIMNYNNQALSQEMAVSTSGSPAEVSAGGLRLNMIPKDGREQLQRVELHRVHRRRVAGEEPDADAEPARARVDAGGLEHP